MMNKRLPKCPHAELVSLISKTYRPLPLPTITSNQNSSSSHGDIPLRTTAVLIGHDHLQA